MPNLLRADLYVLARSRALWIALVVSSAMAVAYFVSARLIADGTYDMSISGSVAGFSDAIALPLLASLLIGVAAASDLENRTVHDRLLAAPRSVHVAVKTVMALAVTAVVLLPYVIGSLVCLSAGWDLVPFLATTPLRVAANAGGGPVTASRVLAGLGLGAVSALVAVARLGFCLPIAFVSRRPLAVTAAGLAGGFLLDGVTGMVADGDAGAAVLRFTPWSPDLPLDLTSPGADVALSAVVSAAFLVLWAVVGWLVLRRADIS